jgi:hypothetical protein
MHTTDHVCADSDCGEKLLVTEVVVLLQVVIPKTNEHNQLYYEQFLNAQQEFAYEPYFFHDGCWANTANVLSELLIDMDCCPEEDQYCFGHCGACGGGLRVHEPMGLIEMGEFNRATRVPDGHGSTFIPYEQPAERYCLSCLRAINDEIIELWDSISFAGECAHCTFDHNWRTGTPCHHSDTE